MDELDLHRGEIYLLKNRENGKCYIGQARKYVSQNNNKWGTNGRWKSHVREAISKSSKDHCLLLNQAIRKYGSAAFDVSKLCDCDIKDMNTLETKYIEEYNSVGPNGYNMTHGGDGNRNSDFTKQNKQTANSARGAHAEATKSKISQGQLGNRRGTKARKYEEDITLPKYVCARRENGVISGYLVKCFPIGVDSKDYISKSFDNRNNPNDALKDALAYLDSLKEQYKDVVDKIEEKKQAAEKMQAIAKVTEKQKQKLPDYINPIISDDKVVGYYVEGLINDEGVTIPKKEFKGNTNRWNYDKALKYVEQINMLISNKVKVDDWSKIDTVYKRDKKGIDKEVLPKYINVKFYKGEKCGYNVNGYPIKQEDGTIKKINTCFTNSKFSMEERYKMALDYLEELKRNHPIEK